MKFNGGGHINHSIFWQNLCPEKDSGEPSAPLLEAINRDFGSVQAMQEKLSASTIAVQGSGWGWLGYNKTAGKLAIATCANQVLSMSDVHVFLPSMCFAVVWLAIHSVRCNRNGSIMGPNIFAFP